MTRDMQAIAPLNVRGLGGSIIKRPGGFFFL